MLDSPESLSPAEGFVCFIEDLQRAGHQVELQTISENPSSLNELAAALEIPVEQLHKTVCLNYKENGQRILVAVITSASARVDTNKVKAALEISGKVKSAQASFIEAETGFKPGGIPPIGFEAIRLIDSQALNHPRITAGGGNNLNSYTSLDPKLLQKLYPNAIVGDFNQ